MIKKRSFNLPSILGIILLCAGVLILVVYAIAYIFDKSIIMPCNYQVTVSTLISFGIAFVWKLIEGEKK